MWSGLVDPNVRRLPEVERRAAVLRDLLRQSGWKVTAEVADVGFETSPVLAISLTSRPTERRVYAQLLMALGVSVNERATLLELEIKAIRLLKDSMVRVLVFDEVHNLLAGSPRAN